MEALRDRLRDIEYRFTSAVCDDLRLEAADLIDALLKQEPVGQVTEVLGSLKDLTIVTWRGNPPDAGTLLYAAPKPEEKA
jgi:hypothetical protein